MKYSLEIVETEIIISADNYGRFSSVEKLIDDVIHLKSLYRVDAVKANHIDGPIVDVSNVDLAEIESLIELPVIIACPNCRTTMNEGVCYFSDELKSIFKSNIRTKDVVFKDLDEEVFLVLEEDKVKEAYSCRECGMTIIP